MSSIKQERILNISFTEIFLMAVEKSVCEQNIPRFKLIVIGGKFLKN